MNAPALRPYQSQAVADFESALAAGHRAVLLAAATGAGKTVIAAEVIRVAVAKRQRVLFIAHRRELVQQASAKLHGAGVDHGVIAAGLPSRPSQPVQVASIQTLHARAIRGSGMEMPAVDLLVIDEAHHARARTYRKVVDACPGATVLGLSATPSRGDGRGLGNLFDCMAACPPVADLIQQGWLVPTRCYAPTEPDLAGVQVRRGDYVERQLADRMNQATLVGDVVEHWHRLAEGRPTVLFASGVDHSVHLRDEFRRSGVWAEHIDGSTPADERDATLQRLAGGKVQVVCNAQVLTEGWDCPEAGCLILARPTRSLVLYRQMIGRVMRPAPGKSDALVLDHSGAVFTHGLPEEPIDWTLDSDKRAENRAHSSRSAGRSARLTKCPECHAVRFAGQACTICNWQPRRRPLSADVADGELARVDRDGTVQAPGWSMADKRRFYRGLLWIAREKGYKPGVAFYKYQEKFKEKPLWHWRHDPPEPPDDSLRAWFRSRQIAYAKARGRAA